MKNVHLIIIDPQKDFCNPNGSLFVPGADEDMKKVARMVDRLRMKLTDIHVTLDSHRPLDISHPMWWVDSAGKPPAPFTMISVKDMENHTWRTKSPGAQDRTMKYLRALEKSARYPHVIWPEHCLIGDEGSTIVPELSAALHEWERTRYATTDFVTKGSNPWTEHFSAVMAEVPDPEDPTSQINTGLIQTMEEADITVWCGEALSHCLANSARDVAANFSDPKFVKQMVLLTDAASNVTSFEQYGKTFIDDMVKKGMQLSTTVDFLS